MKRFIRKQKCWLGNFWYRIYNPKNYFFFKTLFGLRIFHFTKINHTANFYRMRIFQFVYRAALFIKPYLIYPICMVPRISRRLRWYQSVAPLYYCYTRVVVVVIVVVCLYRVLIDSRKENSYCYSPPMLLMIDCLVVGLVAVWST